MRKYILLAVLATWGLANLRAQQRPSAIQIGFMQAQQSAKFTEQDSAFFLIYGGATITSNNFTIGANGNQLNAGFAYPVNYFNQVFDQDVFISKGYFPDVVQIQWNILSNADRIERFLVYRKPLGSTADSTLVASISADTYAFSDEFIQQGVLYKYSIFAQGIVDEFRIPFINIVEGTGFAFPLGVVSGRITFEGGTAVKDVTVVAETDGNLQGKSIYFDGQESFLNVPDGPGNPELVLNQGFTSQIWTKFEGVEGDEAVLFSKGDNYRLSYDGTELKFRVKNSELVLPYQNPVDSFFHISAVYNRAEGELALHALTVDHNQVFSTMAISDHPEEAFENINFGRDGGGNFYKGYLDELRLWNAPLDSTNVLGNYSRYLSGMEDNLAGYWKLDAGVGNEFYDFSQPAPGDFNENHGNIFSAEFSELTPGNSQLAYKGVTDANGNYTIRGFPFESSGSLYRFTPILGVHEFEPTEQIRFVGPSEAIHNEIDFEDISSFEVSGTVRYSNTTFPVEGVSVLIDNQPALDEEGQLILTDNLGQFTVDVPIGLHHVRLAKNQHVFEQGGRFPVPTVDDNSPRFDFQQPLSGLEFLDSTLVKFVGRVVGGPRERDKLLGFGLSKDNVGDATIDISSEKGFNLSLSGADSVVVSDDPIINSEVTFNAAQLSISADPETGEFISFLPPEKYFVSDVRSTQYAFDNTYNISFDLRSFFLEKEVLEDTLQIEVGGEPLDGFPPFDPADFEDIITTSLADSVFTVGVDTFRFDARRDFILRLNPSIDVTNIDGGDLFGEVKFDYKDEVQEAEVLLIENDAYTFGHPVFRQGNRYAMRVSVFEEYMNDESELDRVPVSDGQVEIINELSQEREATINLDHLGKATYVFAAGLPSLSLDVVNPENSFTKTISISTLTGERGDIRTDWNSGDPLRAYIFGGVAQGNNFVTNGPAEIVTILRDPPGSNSYAFLEKGQTIEKTKSWSVGESSQVDASVSVDLGAKVTTFVGLGAGVINESEVINDNTFGISSTSNYEESGEQSISITTTKSWTTDELFPFISSPGDIFVGYSTNLVYGTALSLQPLPITDEECVNGDCSSVEVNGFKLGKRTALRVNPEFGTSFIFSQLFIEDELVPNFKSIRNSFLIYNSNPDAVTATDEVVYLSLVPPNDPRYGTSNADKAAWGDDANAFIGQGPSYKILLPDAMDPADLSDTVDYYNNQINEWEYWLGENERQKVQAILEENISIDGGAEFEQSMTIEESDIQTRTFSFELNTTVANELGFSVFDTGVKTNIAQTVGTNGGESFGNTSVNTTTYGFVLGDDDGALNNGGTVLDYHSIDVKKPADGFGPVFTLRAGATSCPYEGEELTQYFEPGQHVLSFATLQTEKVELRIDNPLVSNVPENRDAEVSIQLVNNSESENSLWFRLAINDTANPDGAIFRVDGKELDGEGRSFLVNFGETLNKTVTISKGAGDVFDYEDLSLRLISECNATILDEKSLSVFFQRACSDIRLLSPLDQWVLNTNIRPVNTQNISFDQYDLQNTTFEFAAFQYKPSSSSTWITDVIFYNPNLFSQSEYDAFDEPKAWLDESGNTQYPWDMGDLPDRDYDIRVITSCELGEPEATITPSDIAAGTKDVSRPQLFGTPQPGDGVLNVGDDISVKFSEEIEAGLLTPFNFSMRGVLNNTPIDHNASIKFDGVDDYVRISNGLNLRSDFTIFFWVRRQEFNAEYILFSKGNAPENAFEMGFTSDNKLFVNISGQTIESSQSYPTTGDSEWEYYGIVFDAQTNELSAYRNGLFVLEKAEVTSTFSGEGPIAIGKSQITNSRYFTGNIHQLRIWNKTLQQGEIVADKDLSLTGSEPGLVGCWAMNEATGNISMDKARFRHAVLFAEWQVDPRGYAFLLDGVDDYLELNTGSTVTIEDETDFSIEFWFNATAGQTNTVLFSNGLADGTDEFNNATDSWNIGINQTGELYILNNGTEITVDGSQSFVDNDWHHFAVSVNRIGTVNIHVDGKLEKSAPSSGLGGLSGSKMWLGARINNIGTTSTNQQQFFNGIIDEFRIWKTNRKKAQIELGMNTALQGDEVGLAAYYPFESFEINAGVPIRTPSFDDQWDNPFGPNGGTAINLNGADFTENTATIKVSRPVSSIDFDWVVNTDEIIITPSAAFENLIQGTVIEISVEGVEDKYQNRLSAPITWTAFVDLNQVKWGDNVIAAKKPLGEAYSFDVEIINSSGTEQSYNLDNFPAWLVASPQSGILQPLSSTTVRFTVNEGLNTGYYDHDIFLNTDLGFSEKLQLNIEVQSETPDWQIDPSDFQFSMNVIALLRIENILSTDQNDMVAAFVGDEIRGVTNLEYVPQLDQYHVYLDIYSNNASGETVELRVWDASQGIEYRNAQPFYEFVSNELKGSPAIPEIIDAGNESVQNFSLLPGWNWKAFTIQSSELTDVDVLLEPINANNGDQIKTQDQADVYTEGIGWLGTISLDGGFKVGPMYQMLIQNGGEFEVVGSQAGEVTIPIKTGWNWIGFTPRFNQTIDEAFAAFAPEDGDIVKSQLAFSVYDSNLGWVGSLQSLSTGGGYLLYSGKDGDLKFPLISSLNSAGRVFYQDPEPPINVNPHDYAHTMTVIATSDLESLESESIYVNNGDEVLGESRMIKYIDDDLYFITIYGNKEGIPLNFSSNSTNGKINFVQQLTFGINDVVGSLSNPLALTGFSPVAKDYIQVYPNPFEDTMTIEIATPESGDIEVALIDLTGRIVEDLSIERSKGNAITKWNIQGASSLPAGIYTLKVTSDNSIRSLKIVKN